MKVLKIHDIKLILPLISGLLILCIPFANDPHIINGSIYGKTNWLIYSVFIFGICSGLLELVSKPTQGKLLLPDIFLLLFLLWIIVGYDWALDPNREKLYLIGLLGCLWFCLRSVLSQMPTAGTVYFVFILLIGTAEALFGLAQIYGFTYSNHSLFKMTGSFFNPGPFSGYIASILPLSLGVILKINAYKKQSLHHKLASVLSWVCMLSIILVLPSGMSRSAWLAGGGSCLWLVWQFKKEQWKQFYINHKRVIRFALVGVTIVCLISLAGLYFLKKDSANGRLFMWKITSHVVLKHPVSGTGLAGFSAAYAQAQGAYFASGKSTRTERRVAGSPEYAFNEYLHVASETGFVGLFLFIGWIGSILWLCIKRKQYIVASGILSICIFSFSSYPLQQSPFWVLLIFLSVIGLSIPEQHSFSSRKQKKMLPYSGLITCFVISFLFYQLKDYKDTYKSWKVAKIYSRGSEYTVNQYEKLYDKLCHQPEFLFEYAQCLYPMKEYNKAIVLLERAEKLSGDPMIRCILGKNYQAIPDYEKAESYYQEAVAILPERIYPFFLLTKLYAEPEFFHEEKFNAAADSVLYKTPKIESTAILEMRRDVMKLKEK
ncbi:MAG: O-antigen ligase family protein [Tannerellaceae bacterium]|nr:O-antigen ligase family protein [Tannerellaceae bacterium]